MDEEQRKKIRQQIKRLAEAAQSLDTGLRLKYHNDALAAELRMIERSVYEIRKHLVSEG